MYINMNTIVLNMTAGFKALFLTSSTSSVMLWEGPRCTGLSMTTGLSRDDETVRGGWLAIELMLGSSPASGTSTQKNNNNEG